MHPHDNTRGACVPVFRDVDGVYGGCCGRLKGGMKVVPGAPEFSLTVTNPQTDLWQDEETGLFITADNGTFYELR